MTDKKVELDELTAKKKQLVVDLEAARKDDEGHVFAKFIEDEIVAVDSQIQKLKEVELHKSEKIEDRLHNGVPLQVVQPKKVESPKPTNIMSDAQIHEVFKMNLQAPTSVAFDMVKVCDIFAEAANDLYFAWNPHHPIIQKGIRDLLKTRTNIINAMKAEAESKN